MHIFIGIAIENVQKVKLYVHELPLIFSRLYHENGTHTKNPRVPPLVTSYVQLFTAIAIRMETYYARLHLCVDANHTSVGYNEKNIVFATFFVCMCMSVCVRPYVYVCMCTSVRVRPYVYVRMCTVVCVRLYVYVCMCTPVRVRLYVYVCMCMCVCVAPLSGPNPWRNT